jgi:hypothetical protein
MKTLGWEPISRWCRTCTTYMPKTLGNSNNHWRTYIQFVYMNQCDQRGDREEESERRNVKWTPSKDAVVGRCYRVN